MKIYKDKVRTKTPSYDPFDRPVRENIASIIRTKDGTSYSVSYEGPRLVKMVISSDQYFKICTKDLSFLEETVAELGYTLKDVNVAVESDIESFHDDADFRAVASIHLKNKPVNQMPYGIFTFRADSYGRIVIKNHKVTKSDVILIENKNLKGMVKDFFTNKASGGRKNKKGILCYGPPGNGKSTEIMELFELCEEFKMRVFLIDADSDIGQLEQIRHLLQDDNNVFVLEEMTERLRTKSLETLLTFLDGETSWNNSVTIATTNYPEDFPANLVDRPGRFETFIEYNNPDKEQIIKLGEAFGFDEASVSCLAGQSLSYDYVSYILSLTKKTGLSVKETRDNEEQKRKRLSSTFRGKMGI